MEFPSTTATLHTLHGDLVAILDEDHAAPVVSAQIWVETGSQHEGGWAGSGLSHLLEHMVFKGTKSFSGPELAARVNAAGGQWNAYTSFDRTVYYIDGPDTSLASFLDVLFELVFLPALPNEDFETERDVIRREIDMGNDDPDTVGSNLLFRTFFQHDPRRHPVIGHLDLFNALAYEDMTVYHRRRYLPSNSFVILSGAFDRTAVLDNLNERASRLASHPLAPNGGAPEPHQIGARQSRLSFPIPVSKTTLAWQTPGLDHPDSPALELLSGVLGGGRSSLLYRKFHEEKGLAHQIGTWAWITRDAPGMFSVSAEVDAGRRDELEAAILHETAAALDHPGRLQPELDKARRLLFAQQFRSLSTAAGRAADLGSNWHEARHLDFTRHYLQALERVTTDDLQRVGRAYLLDERLTIASLDPEQTAAQVSVPAIRRSPGSVSARPLSNGMTLVLRRDPRVPTVHLQAVFRSGSLVETVSNCGINTLHSCLLSKGTRSLTATGFAHAVESLGASFRATAGNNTSMVSAFCLKPDFDTLLALVAEALAEPALPSDAFERERDAQTADLLEALEDPLKTAFRILRQRLFGNEGYGLPRLGTEASLASLTPDAVRRHHETIVTRRNGVLAVFGDIDPDSVADLCEERFARLPEGHPPGPISHPRFGAGEVEARLDKQQAVLAIGFPGAPVDAEDLPALEVLHEYCSNMAGPLFTRLREELGLAYYVSAAQFHGLGTGLFAFYIGTAPDKLNLARRELLAQIEKLATEGIPEVALEHSRTSVLASDALDNQSNRAMAQTCALNTLFGLGPLHHEEHARKVRALTSDDLRQTTARYFGHHPPVIATVVPDRPAHQQMPVES